MTAHPAPVDATIRALRPADILSAADLLVLAAGEDKRHRLLDQLATVLPGEIHHALVAERSGKIVGAGKLTAEPAFPGTVSALVAVAEDERGRGIGTALAAELAGWAERHLGPEHVVTSTLRDDLDAGRRFAQRYGLVVTRHSVGWRFDLLGRSDELAERATRTANAAGVRIRVADLQAEEAAIVECIGRTLPGLPLPGAEDQEVDLAHARRVIPDEATVLVAESLDAPGLPPCGLTVVTPQAGSGDWYTVYTGVAVDRRGRGVATALKAAALEQAYRSGATAVTTHNDDGNEPILRANRAFGMLPSVGYWSLLRRAA
ncbi:GNAT family N-acetyltransferase [Micromonospora parathelypteridis]|uniref:GNAT superfamily N-acetyltransferase n=1 Tax=Micromonospora parathelypteridis TaxID=1839617 RepID=A0A840W4W6_9ACTN|nr:GNAT family N-acetyltransferase [Micromonospora parathelypteridis]MBB5480128.1 GNAT superfamily N-acetyltransferase [Micromonospora parathelypteridis]